MAKGNAALSVSLTAFATLACIVMTPFNLEFWGGLYGPTNAILKTVALDPFELFKLILLILGIPLISGMLVNYKFPEISKKIERILKPFSMIVFLGLIVGAFYENIDIFLNYIYLVAALVIFHNI